MEIISIMIGSLIIFLILFLPSVVFLLSAKFIQKIKYKRYVFILFLICLQIAWIVILFVKFSNDFQRSFGNSL